MEKVSEKACKMFRDVRKDISNTKNRTGLEKIKSTDPVVHSDVLRNKCCYCFKVFLSSKFLLKHILRRHSEDLISFYKDIQRTSKSENSNFKNLTNLLSGEFSSLKNEVNAIKAAIATLGSRSAVETFQHFDNSDLCQEIETSSSVVLENRSSPEKNAKVDTPETHKSEVKTLSKLYEVENDIDILKKKVEHLFSIVNHMSSDLEKLKDVDFIAEHILKIINADLIQCQSNLTDKMQSLLAEQIETNYMKWKVKYSKIEKEIAKLNNNIQDVTNLINSPSYFEKLQKKLESQLMCLFLDSKQDVPKSVKQKSKFCQISSQKPELFNSKSIISDNINLSLENCKSKEQEFFSETSKSQSNLKCKQQRSHFINESKSCKNVPDKLLSLINEKMGYYNVSADASKVSSVESDKIIGFINVEKNCLMEKYPEFPVVYDKINFIADQKVAARLQNKQKRKLRFSEPLHNVKKKDKKRSRKANENKTFPVVEMGNVTYNSDLGGAGDCSWNMSNTKQSQQLESTVIEDQSHNSNIDHDLKSSKTNSRKLDCRLESETEFRHKVIDVPDKLKHKFQNYNTLIHNSSISELNRNLEMSELKEMDNLSLKSLSSWEGDNDFQLLHK